MSMKHNGGEKKKKPAAGRGGARQQDQGKNDGGTITVVLKLGIYCDDCADKATKSVKGFPGVESAKVDAGSGELTVVGKVDPSKLRDHVAKKTKKHVDLVSPTKKPDVVDNDIPSRRPLYDTPGYAHNEIRPILSLYELQPWHPMYDTPPGPPLSPMPYAPLVYLAQMHSAPEREPIPLLCLVFLNLFILLFFFHISR